MRLSRSPDLSATWRLTLVALLVWAIVCGIQIYSHPVTSRLGDTDDAMRIVLVRDLLSGRGWYDQWIGRLQPPHGIYLHWSRLLDGALAGMIWFFEQFTTPKWAEWTARLVWPLLWILPLVAAALAIARNLGGRAAVLLCAPVLLIDMNMYRQFVPGRVDHHNIMIATTVIALACATARQQRARWAAVGGVATALGLAIGLEALPLLALIGASYGLELMRNREGARPAAAYGLALAIGTLVFFGAQTPPWRWSLSFCDAIALNLVGALTVAGLGLGLTAALAGRIPAWARIALVGLAGVLAVAAYVAIDPVCIHGPFAEVNPAVKPFWLNHIQEMQHLPVMFKRQREAAIIASVTAVMAVLASFGLLAPRWRTLPTTHLLIVACMVTAAVEGWFAWRLQDYVFGVGLPVLGAAFSLMAARWLRDLLVPSVAMAVVLSPTLIGGAAEAAIKASQTAKTPPPTNQTRNNAVANISPARPVAAAVPAPALAQTKRPPAARPIVHTTGMCSNPGAYHTLSRLPAGVVMSETDFGPYILAFTHHSAMAAPYHRMSWGILAAHDAFNTPPARAEAKVRALKITYIVDCPPYPMFVDSGSFGDRLRGGDTPPWLERLTGPQEILQIYRVRTEH